MMSAGFEVLFVRVRKELKTRLMRLAIAYDSRGSLNNYVATRLAEIADIDEKRLREETKQKVGS